MSEVRRCPDHGPFEGEACPACGEAGDRQLNGHRRKRLSTFASGALRHFPADAGLKLNEQGWTDYTDFVKMVIEKYDWGEPEHVAGAITTDPKGRFERSGDQVRAAYGHSVDVDLEPAETSVPNEL